MSTETQSNSASNLEKVLKAGEFAFTGELGPPRGTDTEEVIEKALPEAADALEVAEADVEFSAIDAAFYERLGFVSVPAWEYNCDDPAALASSSPAAPSRARIRSGSTKPAVSASILTTRRSTRWAERPRC